MSVRRIPLIATPRDGECFASWFDRTAARLQLEHLDLAAAMGIRFAVRGALAEHPSGCGIVLSDAELADVVTASGLEREEVTAMLTADAGHRKPSAEALPEEPGQTRGGHQRVEIGRRHLIWQSWERRTAYAVRRCTEDREIPLDLRPFAERVVLAILLAGLPMYDNELAADGEDCGVELTIADLADPVEYGPALQVVWRQRQGNMLSPPWRLVQTIMHEALQAILTANGFQIVRGLKPSAAPVVIAD